MTVVIRDEELKPLIDAAREITETGRGQLNFPNFPITLR